MSKSQGKGARGKQNLTFVRQVPKFLQHTLKDEPDILSKALISNPEFDDKPDEEYNELLAEKEERPQIVVLNKFKDVTEEEATKHFIKEGKLPAPKVTEEKEVEKTPALDKDGRILFRTKVKSTEASGIENSLESTENDPSSKKRSGSGASKTKKAKKPKNFSLLSFEMD